MEYRFSLPFAVEAPTEDEARSTAALVRSYVSGLALHPSITRVDAPDLAGEVIVVVKDDSDKPVAIE